MASATSFDTVEATERIEPRGEAAVTQREIEIVIEALTPRRNAELIGLSPELADRARHALIQLWLMALGDLVWRPTWSHFAETISRMTGGRYVVENEAAAITLMVMIAQEVFTNGSGNPDDSARLRYQLRFLKKHGRLDIDYGDNSNEVTGVVEEKAT